MRVTTLLPFAAIRNFNADYRSKATIVDVSELITVSLKQL